MSADPRVSIHPDSTVLMAAIAARLITKLVDIQDKHGEATVVLTGGSSRSHASNSFQPSLWLSAG